MERAKTDDALSFHFNEAATGALVGTVKRNVWQAQPAWKACASGRPADKSILQIGRFSIPYELGED